MSKLDAHKMEVKEQDLYLVRFINHIATIFEIRAQKKDLNFSVELDSNVPAIVRADETQIRQILSNLLSNAIKFTDTGSVTLSVSCLNFDSNSGFEIVRFEIQGYWRGYPSRSISPRF